MNIHDGVKKIALSLNFARIPGWSDSIEWTKTILRTLTLVCFMQGVSDGHQKVLDAMSHFKNKNMETHRFETLVKEFSEALYPDLRVRSKSMCLQQSKHISLSSNHTHTNTLSLSSYIYISGADCRVIRLPPLSLPI